MNNKRKLYLSILAIIGVLLVISYVKHLVKGGDKQEFVENPEYNYGTDNAPTLAETCKGMHFAYGAEDTTTLVIIQKELERSFPDAPQLDTVTSYLNKLRDKFVVINKQRAESFSKLRKNEDKFEHTTWYKNSHFTHDANSNHLSLYIGQKENDIWLRLKISYYGNDWIFFDKAQLLIGNYSCTIPFNQYKDKDTDNSSGKVWEWIDVPVDETLITSIGTLGTADKASIRLSGKYSDERDITSIEKKAFQQVLDGYMYLLSQGNSGIIPDVE